MPEPRRKTSRIGQVLILGLLLAVIAYLLHPDSGYIDLTINGKPVAGPLPALPVLLLVAVILLVTLALAVAVAVGVGIFLFGAATAIGLLAILAAAPYMLPIVILVLIVYGVFALST